MHVRVLEIDVDELRSSPVRRFGNSSDQLLMTGFARHPHDLVRLDIRAEHDRKFRQTLHRLHAAIVAHQARRRRSTSLDALLQKTVPANHPPPARNFVHWSTFRLEPFDHVRDSKRVAVVAGALPSGLRTLQLRARTKPVSLTTSCPNSRTGAGAHSLRTDPWRTSRPDCEIRCA